jgi:hypothetical protein
VCILLGAVAARAEGFRPESAGVRVGFPANRSGADFRQVEAFVDWDLRRPWDLGREWHLQPRLDLSAGWLGDQGGDAAIVAAGPTLVLGWKRFPVSLEGGVSPTVISLENFQTKDLGTDFQFTSHIGVNWDFASQVRLSYRFQHMSNAGIGENNPGLNLHMVGLSYLF